MSASLRVVNNALCPKCKGKDTFRAGTVAGTPPSGEWRCRGCAEVWRVPMLAVTRIPTKEGA
jgi:hypothetical protein